MRIRGIETFLELRQPNELAQHGLGHEGGWHGKHEVLHQHAWAWAPAQAQYPCHGQAQGNHLHHKLGPGAPTQAQIQCHEQAQNTHSPHKLIPPPGHHPRTELPVAGGTKSWAAVEVGGYRARQVPGTSAADVEGGNDRAVGVAGLSS